MASIRPIVVSTSDSSTRVTVADSEAIASSVTRGLTFFSRRFS